MIEKVMFCMVFAGMAGVSYVAVVMALFFIKADMRYMRTDRSSVGLGFCFTDQRGWMTLTIRIGCRRYVAMTMSPRTEAVVEEPRRPCCDGLI